MNHPGWHSVVETEKSARKKKWTCQWWIEQGDGWLLRSPWYCGTGDVFRLRRHDRGWTTKIDRSNWKGCAALHNQPIDLTKRAIERKREVAQSTNSSEQTNNWKGRATLHNQPMNLTKRTIEKKARRCTVNRKIWGLRHATRWIRRQIKTDDSTTIADEPMKLEAVVNQATRCKQQR